jgi:metallo-beta-lactamase class B
LLLDAGFENKAEALAAQLQKAGLDPARVKFILLGHGHADHFGGAKFFQDKYGTKIAATAEDWDLINAPAAAWCGTARRRWRETRKECRARGRPAVCVRRSHGHTDRDSRPHAGLACFHLPRERERKDTLAGLFGGTVLTTGILTTDALKQYTQSIAHYLETARKMNVEVELQNHPIF